MFGGVSCNRFGSKEGQVSRAETLQIADNEQ